jgi:tetratricopeptide (TPR) repeat protein
LKASAGTAIGHDSDASSGSLERSEIEVRTPDAESFVLDKSTNRHFQADLRRRLSLSPGPSCPIFTRDDLGITEILCWESVGYFESALSVHARTLSGPNSIASDPTTYLFNSVNVAYSLASSSRYADARVMLNNSFDELKYALTLQSVALLPALLGVICAGQEEETPFNVWKLYREHAADLCRVYLGVRHPITVIVRSFRDTGDKNQALNAVLGSLLATVLKKAEFGEAHVLPISLMQQQADTLEDLGQFEEAERILRRALTICLTAYGTGHWMTLRVLRDVAWRNLIRLRNYAHAEGLFYTVLRYTVDEEGKVIQPSIRSETLEGLAHIAVIGGDLPKAEDLLRHALEILVKEFGPKYKNAIYLANLLEATLREQGKHSEADQLSCLYRLRDEYSL